MGKPLAPGTQSVAGSQDLSPVGLMPRFTLFQSTKRVLMSWGGGWGLRRRADGRELARR